MNLPVFNEAFLNSIAVQRGKDEVVKAIGSILTTSLEKFENKEVKNKVTLAMVRYGKAADGLAQTNDAESLLDMLEQLRKYTPLLTQADLDEFEQKASAMIHKLRDVSNLNYPTDPEKFHKVSKDYLEKALLYRSRIATARAFFDVQCINELYDEWNKIALEWALAIGEAFPVNEENPQQDFRYATN